MAGLDSTVFVAEVVGGGGSGGRGAWFLPIPGTGSGDQMPFPATCVSSTDLPCAFDSHRFTAFAGSRSLHTGGVNVLLGSGVARFVSASIDHEVWIGVHGIAGAEPKAAGF